MEIVWIYYGYSELQIIFPVCISTIFIPIYIYDQFQFINFVCQIIYKANLNLKNFRNSCQRKFVEKRACVIPAQQMKSI